MNIKNLIISSLILISGIFAGYYFGNSRTESTGVHKMPDGSIMSNDMSMSAMMADMNAVLSGKKGDDFDKAFIDEMIIHHQGAVDMAKLALKNAKHKEIQNMANAIISAQTKEINQMMDWKDSWYR